MAHTERGDAFSLLSKWKNEAAGLLISFDDTEVSFSGVGCIKSLSEELVEFEGTPTVFRFSTVLTRVKRFEYSDLREESAEFRMSHGKLVDHKLVMHLPLGGCVRIFSRKPTDERT